MFKKLLLGLTLLASSHSFAGQDGNGGFGLSCAGKNEILDLYEAKERYKLNIDLGPASLSVDQKVELMLKRLEKFQPRAAERYREQHKKLWTVAEIINGLKIVKNDDILVGSEISTGLDIGTAIIPENCKLIPLARNILDTQFEKNIYFIGKYWNSLNNNTKAALILHELIYFDSISEKLKDSELGVKVVDSLDVRKLIGILSSKEIEKMAIDQFLNFTLKKMIYDGVKPVLNATLLFPEINGHLVDGIETGPDKFVMSEDRKYVKEFSVYSYHSYKNVLFLNQKVKQGLMPGFKKIEFINPTTPSNFWFAQIDDSINFVHKFSNGEISFKVPKGYYARAEISDSEKIKKLCYIDIDIVSSSIPVIETFDSSLGACIEFNEDNLVSKFTGSGLITTAQWKARLNFEIAYFYQNDQLTSYSVSEIFSPSIKTSKYIKNTDGYVSKALFDQNNSIRCAYPTRSRSEPPILVKLNKAWVTLPEKASIEFNAEGIPVGLDCKIPEPKSLN